ncbi:unnamed protein product [Paramecium primaurelia]|uniref:Uncharacterized protein n=1 Tax=Paramecium primaurelia TaxID=5886 RepID=A0A8S1NAH4_PARPR|nr:unnamed protein product [Paramecium primaurelia]
MEGQQYQYLMADEYFLENNESYSSFSLGDIQFFVNLNDFEAPIFQPSKIQNPYVSLIGNYCMSDSSIIVINKVDPIFVAIRVLRNKLANEKQVNSIEFENIFNSEDSFEIYLSKHKQIKENIDCISFTKQFNDDLYVKLDKGKLFQFLDIKYNSIREYSQQSVYFLNDCNQKKQDESQLQSCNLFQQYIGDQLFTEYKATKKTDVTNQVSTVNFDQQQITNKKQEEKEKQEIQNKQKSKSLQIKKNASEIKNAKASQGCGRLDQSFLIKKVPKQEQ